MKSTPRSLLKSIAYLRRVGVRTRLTRNAIFTALFAAALALNFLPGNAHAQLTVDYTFNTNTNVPDGGQLADVQTLGGLSVFSNVTVSLNLTSASGSTMFLGDLYSTLTFGTATETNRTAVLLNRPGRDNTHISGSTLSSLNVTLDDTAGTNIWSTTSSTGTFKSDGRSTVNPAGPRQAFDGNDYEATMHPYGRNATLAALNGSSFTSNKFTLLMADYSTPNQALLTSWGMTLTGTAAGTGTMAATNGSMSISDGAGTTNTLGAALVTTQNGSGGTLNVNLAGTTTLNGGISGSGALNKQGVGTLIFNSSATYTGATTITGGTLQVGNGGGAGTLGSGNVTDNGALVFNTSSNLAVANTISGTGTVTQSGSGTTTFSGSTGNTYTGLTTVSNGELDLNKSSGNAIAGDGSTATNDVTVNGGTLKWLANNQVGDTATITISGSGTVNLNGMTETLGSLINNGGTFQTGVNGSLTGTTATINFAGGTNTINSGGSVTDGHIILSGASTISEVEGGGMMYLQSGGMGMQMTGTTLTLDSTASGTAGKLVLEGDVATTASSTTSVIASGGNLANAGFIDMMTGTRVFTVASGTTSSGIDLSVTAKVTSPGGALTKEGAGVMQLTGANTYAGGTNVNAGTLLANNATGSATGAGAVMVNNGGTLGGTGTIAPGGGNNVQVNGGGTITGATNGTIGALTLSSTNLVFSGTMGSLATYVVDLNASTSDLLAISGNLDLSTLFDQISFQFTNTGASSYQLITYTGTLSGTFDTVSNLPSGYSINYVSGEIDLVLTAVPEPGTWATGTLVLASLIASQRRRLTSLLPRRNRARA